jgi:hypothetical protein
MLDATAKGKIDDTPKRTAQRGTHTKFCDDGKTMVVKESNETPGSAIETYRRLHGIPYYDSERDRMEVDWRTSITRKDARNAMDTIAANVGHKDFDSLHHTFPQSFLEQLDELLPDNQRKMLENKLDVHLTKGSRALSNLYSNLSIGPQPRNRTDDLGCMLDATFYRVEGKEHSYLGMDPISAEYQALYKFFEKIKQEGRNVGKLSNKEFIDNIAKHLERAEKIHVVLTGGYKVNPNVSMWKKSNDNTWEKGPIPISEKEWGTKQILVDSYTSDYFTLSALKRLFPTE